MTGREGAPRVLFAGGGTGGHLYPALALADALQRQRPDASVHFVGAERGIEARVLPQRALPHTLLPVEPIRRARPWQNWRLVPSLTRSILRLRNIFRDFPPDLVVGTGGYASGPVAGWAILNRIPVALQEQNSYPGFTTRRLARWARQVHLAFPEAARHLHPGRHTEVIDSGNPIRPPDRSLSPREARARFGLGEGPVVLVVGGSQGARAINEALLADLARVRDGGIEIPCPDLQILWATGPDHHASIAARLERPIAGVRVVAIPYIEDMTAALASADLALSRAGAMAMAELCAWGIPSLLIPLPTAAANHQFHNAKALSDAGAAALLEERALSPGRLWAELSNLLRDERLREAMAGRARERGRPDAAAEIVRKLRGLL